MKVKNLYKTIAPILLIIAIAATFTGCGGNQETDPDESLIVTTAPAEETDTAAEVPDAEPTEEPAEEAPTAPPKPDTSATAPAQTPTEAPTAAPTQTPTEAPTAAPTQAPTKAPTAAPTQAPTKAPTEAPATATPHVHDFSIPIYALTPRCTMDGFLMYYCKCGQSQGGEYIAPLGHDYKETVVAPTATEQGYTLHECTRCNNSYKDNYTPATGSGSTGHTHNYTEKETKKAGCTTKGEITYTCSCGDSYTKTTPMLSHMFRLTGHADPTCTENGYDEFTCSRCNEVYTVTLSATGHDWEIIDVFVPGEILEQGQSETIYKDGIIPHWDRYNVCRICGEKEFLPW